jgi:hypothetical protein
MSIQEIANQLVTLSRKGDFKQAQGEFYADDAVSIEPHPIPSVFDAETKGLQAIYEKGERWEQLVEEMHGLEVSDPLVAEKHFVIRMMMDLTLKGQGRVTYDELCIYQVKDGKIISEQFFY